MMNISINFIVLLCQLIFGHCQSPCPGFFTYHIDDRTREVFGRIVIPHAPKNTALHLRVSLSVATALITQYVGKLELARSRQDSVKAVKQGLPLIYNLYFPITRPIPILTEIRFNNHQYCVGHRAIGPIVTNIFLEHFLYPPGVKSHSSDKCDTEPAAPTRPIIDQPINNEHADIYVPLNNDDTLTINVISPLDPRLPFRPSHVPSSSSPMSINCGKPMNGIKYLISKGDTISPGQWPWLAAIFITKKKFEFQCAGTLITERHVLTAAHCKQPNGLDIMTNNFLVSLGRYRLDDWRERDSQTLEVNEWIINPDYNNQGSAHGDLAILVLRDRVQMNAMVQPVCLWLDSINLDRVVGRTGYVVGWGKDENGNQHLAAPRIVEAPIVPQEDCLRSNIGFIPATSNKTFCAGHRDGSGPCNGDSGSGLIFLNPTTQQYHLRGIVSLSLLNRENLNCDLTQFVVYVDVAKYSDWINTQISTSP